ITDYFFNDIIEGYHSLRPSKFVNYDREALGVRQKGSQKVERPHRLRDKRRDFEVLRVMLFMIQKKVLRIEHTENFIRAFSVNGNSSVPPDSKQTNRFYVRK